MPAPFPDAQARVNSLVGQIEILTSYTVECGFCGTGEPHETCENPNKKYIAGKLLQDGWRYVAIGDTEGWACPTCIEKAEASEFRYLD